MTKRRVAYVAVREDQRTGQEFIDLQSLSAHREITEHSAAFVRERMPGWNHAHPVSRIGRVVVEEVTEAEAARIEAEAHPTVRAA